MGKSKYCQIFLGKIIIIIEINYVAYINIFVINHIIVHSLKDLNKQFQFHKKD